MMPTKPLAYIKLKYVNSFRDRIGKMRHYFRHGGKVIALPGAPGSKQFIEAYEAAMADLGVEKPNTPHIRNERVYFVLIGEHVKIGVSRRLRARLETFRNSSAKVELLFAMPGSRELERRVHKALAECQIEREIFQRRGAEVFIDMVESHGVEYALEFMYQKSSARRQRRKPEESRAAHERKRREVNARYDALERFGVIPNSWDKVLGNGPI